MNAVTCWVIAIRGLLSSKKTKHNVGEGEDDRVICAICEHVRDRFAQGDPMHDKWGSLTKQCAAAQPGIDYVSGEQITQMPNCFTENWNGRCERFQPKGNEE